MEGGKEEPELNMLNIKLIQNDITALKAAQPMNASSTLIALDKQLQLGSGIWAHIQCAGIDSCHWLGLGWPLDQWQTLQTPVPSQREDRRETNGLGKKLKQLGLERRAIQ